MALDGTQKRIVAHLGEFFLIATQVFEDGDLVEVNADKGIVRRLSRF